MWFNLRYKFIYTISINCDSCEELCKDFCSKCEMVTYILDNNVQPETKDRPKETLPNNIFEIRTLSPKAEGIFALKTIPEGIKFGPCGELEHVQLPQGRAWKLSNGRFINVPSADDTNWMCYVNYAKDTVDQNLTVFQYEGHLFFRTIRKVNEGEELLVSYDEDDKIFVTETASYYCPTVEKSVEDVYACTFCCLGFSSLKHLIKHRVACPCARSKSVLQEIIQCSFCKIYLDETEYLELHYNICSKKYFRKVALSALARQSREKPPTIRVPFTCPNCDFKCNDKSNIARHIKNMHPVDDTKRHKCPRCSFETKYKHSLTRHVAAHEDRTSTNVKPFECDTCKKRFRQMSHLKGHALIHTGKKPFACRHCDYKTNRRDSLVKHLKNVEGKHKSKT